MGDVKRGPKRPMRQAPAGPQLGLGLDVDDAGQPGRKQRANSVEIEGRKRRFIDNDPRDIYIGDVSLEDYLLQQQLDWVFAYRQVLVQLDWSAWGDRYEPVGRPPYHPGAMAGLIVYGLAEGCSSLRRLEEMARKDLASWWVSGGIQPDHSTLGRFITRHADQLRDVLFEETTAEILALMPQLEREVSGDGTTIEAVASRFSQLQKEAAEDFALEVLREAQEAEPEADTASETQKPSGAETCQGEEPSPAEGADEQTDEQLTALEKRAQKLLKIVEVRAKSRRENGNDPDTLRVSHTEPEAMYLKHKDGRYGFGYVPSIIGNRQRFIVAYGVDPGSETGVLEPMVEQSERIFEAVVDEAEADAADSGTTKEGTQRKSSVIERLMLDKNYYALSTLEMAVERGIDLLVPTEDYFKSGDEIPDDGIPRRGGKLAKRAFTRLSAEQMLCPASQLMEVVCSGIHSQLGRPYTMYRASGCQDCTMRGDCTTSEKGRTVKYLQGDALKEGMREVMKQPRVRPIYARRFGAVEPIFSDMQQHGLQRSSRRGVEGATTDVSLHCTGYNFRRLKTMAKKGVIDARRMAPTNGADTATKRKGRKDAKFGAIRPSEASKSPLWANSARRDRTSQIQQPSSTPTAIPTQNSRRFVAKTVNPNWGCQFE